MDCIILAGGKGTRLKQTVPNVPKPLAPIQNKPFLELLLNQLVKSTLINKVILSLGYRASVIIDYCKGKAFPFSIEYSIEKTPLGTGGAVKKAAPFTTSTQVLVINGDSFFDIDLIDFKNTHNKTNADLTIASAYVEDASRFGKVLMNSDNKILQFEEKPPQSSGFINGGMYLFQKKLFEDFPLKDAFSLEKDFFPKLLKKNIIGYPAKNLFMDIGTKDSYLLAQTQLGKL